MSLYNQFHPSLLRCSTPLPRIARLTSGNDIFSRVPAALSNWYNVLLLKYAINLVPSLAAIGAGIVVSCLNVFPFLRSKSSREQQLAGLAPSLFYSKLRFMLLSIAPITLAHSIWVSVSPSANPRITFFTVSLKIERFLTPDLFLIALLILLITFLCFAFVRVSINFSLLMDFILVVSVVFLVSNFCNISMRSIIQSLLFAYGIVIIMIILIASWLRIIAFTLPAPANKTRPIVTFTEKLVSTWINLAALRTAFCDMIKGHFSDSFQSEGQRRSHSHGWHLFIPLIIPQNRGIGR